MPVRSVKGSCIGNGTPGASAQRTLWRRSSSHGGRDISIGTMAPST